MNSFIKNSIRFILLMLVQVFILDRISLHGFATAYIYFLFLLWLPFNTNRTTQMLLAFLLGITLDSFQPTPGFHAAAWVLIAYVRPFLINILIPQEAGTENVEEPSPKTMGGFFTYIIYAAVLSFIHNAWLFLLEAFQVGDVVYFLYRTLLSTILSVVLIVIAELLFTRKQRHRSHF